MNLKINDIGTLLFGDNTTARVKVVKIDTYSYMPDDYWFSYLEEETNRQLNHPDFPDMFPLPIGLVELVFKKDDEEKDLDEYETKLELYLYNNMNKANHQEGRLLFRSLEKLMSKEEIIKQYFK